MGRLPTEQHRRYTVAEYLALEHEAVERHEYRDGEIISMAAGITPVAMISASRAFTESEWQISASARQWRNYAESSPGTCVLTSKGHYLVRHVPATFAKHNAEALTWEVKRQ